MTYFNEEKQLTAKDQSIEPNAGKTKWYYL
jgi:hypothetical protein